MMISAMRSLLFTLLCASVTVGPTNAAYLRPRSWREGFKAVENADNVPGDESTFSRLLGSVSPESVHQLIRDLAPGALRNGVDARAGRPEVPTAIVQLAVRQGTSGNDTTTSDPPTSTGDSTSDTSSTTPPPESSTDTTTTPPTETPTSEPTETTTPTDTPTKTSTDASPTNTPTDTPTQTPTETQPTPTSTSAPSNTQTSDSDEPTSSSPSPTSAPTSDDSSTTSKSSPAATPTPTSRTSTYTSTLPGGAVTTVTEVAVITPGATEEPSPTPTDEGELHHGDAAPNVRGSAFSVLAAVLFGGILLA